jgi:8-oxo-dGTP pyrophosphatase MutT (NUDIX family)
VSLPGGKAEEGDKDDGDTAKREAKEEIGLDPELVNVVTVLEPFLSKVSLLFNTSLPQLKLFLFIISMEIVLVCLWFKV